MEPEKVTVLDRKKEIIGDFVSMNKIIQDDIDKVEADIYIQTHSTNPLLKTSSVDKAIEKIIFTGSGNTFAAGANLIEVSQLNENTAVDFGLRGQRLMQKIYNSEKDTVAAIDGFCMGGALDLAISCDTRIASPDSFFAHPGAKLGIITGWGGTQILPRLIGRKRALEMFLTARRIGTRDALEMGLIDEVSPNPLAKALEKAPQ